jgi:hypothetical protein
MEPHWAICAAMAAKRVAGYDVKPTVFKSLFI